MKHFCMKSNVYKSNKWRQNHQLKIHDGESKFKFEIKLCCQGFSSTMPSTACLVTITNLLTFLQLWKQEIYPSTKSRAYDVIPELKILSVYYSIISCNFPCLNVKQRIIIINVFQSHTISLTSVVISQSNCYLLDWAGFSQTPVFRR